MNSKTIIPLQRIIKNFFGSKEEVDAFKQAIPSIN